MAVVPSSERRERMKCNGEAATNFIREVIISECRAFAEFVTKRLLPTFNNFGKEAIRHGQQWFRDKVSDPGPPNYEDPGAAEYFAEEAYKAAEYFADKAMDETFTFADMLIGMFYASTALYSAGLFHLFEQHAASLQLQFLGAHSSHQEISLKDVIGWLKKEAAVDVKGLGGWDTIYNDLRLVANVVKHAEGSSAAQLRLKRPELFIHPTKRGDKKPIKPVKPHVRKPLFGEDIYITPSEFSRYSEAVAGFWTELARRMGAQKRDVIVDDPASRPLR